MPGQNVSNLMRYSVMTDKIANVYGVLIDKRGEPEQVNKQYSFFVR